ncbi:MAG: zinc ribbon domain-containing protein [Defluviitaleaceae bacterium]|nr:zinc ribbon domain-containing protein [Defluviitaleaceae bacterium]
MFCGKCGVKNADNMNFCGSCGSPVGSKPSVATPPPPAPTYAPMRAAPAKPPVNKLLFVIPVAVVVVVLAGFLLNGNSHGLTGVWVNYDSSVRGATQDFFAEVEFRGNTVITRNHNVSLQDPVGVARFDFRPTQADLDSGEFSNRFTQRQREATRLIINEVRPGWGTGAWYEVIVTEERVGTFSINSDNRMEILWSNGQHEVVNLRITENDLAPNTLSWRGGTFSPR